MHVDASGQRKRSAAGHPVALLCGRLVSTEFLADEKQDGEKTTSAALHYLAAKLLRTVERFQCQKQRTQRADKEAQIQHDNGRRAELVCPLVVSSQSSGAPETTSQRSNSAHRGGFNTGCCGYERFIETDVHVVSCDFVDPLSVVERVAGCGEERASGSGLARKPPGEETTERCEKNEFGNLLPTRLPISCHQHKASCVQLPRKENAQRERSRKGRGRSRNRHVQIWPQTSTRDQERTRGACCRGRFCPRDRSTSARKKIDCFNLLYSGLRKEILFPGTLPTSLPAGAAKSA